MEQKDATILIQTNNENNLDIDSASEVDLDSSVAADTNNEATLKTHEKQLVSEAADSGEDNTNDL